MGFHEVVEKIKMHFDVKSVAIFFGFLAVSLIIMVLIYKLAAKWLKGDYMAVGDTDDEVEDDDVKLDLTSKEEKKLNGGPQVEEKVSEEGVGREDVQVDLGTLTTEANVVMDAGENDLVDLEAGMEEEKPKKKRTLSLKKRKKKQKESTEALAGSAAKDIETALIILDGVTETQTEVIVDEPAHEVTSEEAPTEATLDEPLTEAKLEEPVPELSMTAPVPESSMTEPVLEQSVNEADNSRTDLIDIDAGIVPDQSAKEAGDGGEATLDDIDVTTGEERPKKKRRLSLKKMVKKRKEGRATEEESTPTRTSESSGVGIETSLETSPEKISHDTSFEDIGRETGFEGQFGINAIISISMKYIKHEEKLAGSITTIQDLGTGPDYISFHIKFLPVGKPKVKTHWEPARSSTFSFSFELRHAKVKPLPDSRNSLCIRLYGRQKKTGISRGKCYAECVIPWVTLMNAGEELVKLEQRLHQKGADDDDITSSTDELLSD